MAKVTGYWDTIIWLAKYGVQMDGTEWETMNFLATTRTVELAAFVFGKLEIDVAKDILDYRLGSRNRYTVDA